MKNFKYGKLSNVAIATALTLGLTVGVSGMASAAKHGSTTTTTIAPKKVAFHGTVTYYTAYVTGTAGSITVMNAAGKSVTFSITSSTKVLRGANKKNPTMLGVSDRVEVIALAAASTDATMINVLGVKTNKVVTLHGTVTAYSAYVSGTPGSITVLTAGGNSDTFSITSSTKVLRADNKKNPVTVALNDRVEVLALAATSKVAKTINVLGTK